MGWIRPQDTNLAAQNDISVTVFQKQWIKQSKQYLTNKKLKINLKLDTGMGRLGIRTVQQLDQLMAEIQQIQHPNNFIIEGIYTHFSQADQQDISYFLTQKTKFNQLTSHFIGKWNYQITLHVGNSAASIRFPKNMKNSVRFGIGIYGLYPSQIVKQQNIIQLKPAMSLFTKITHIKQLQQGQSVGYGRSYTTRQKQWIATIPIGYADGIPRKYQGQQVLIQGKRYPTVGRVCMDQMMVKVDQQFPIGTKVVIIGSSGEDKITIEDIANKLQTINYQVLCLFSQRIPRIYIRTTQTK